MRIISGTCRGRKLVKLDGLKIRPTSDRIREAIFNILGPAVRGTKVLDLFAGTGALGLEALSRGAIHATFVDQSCDIIRQNVERCHLEKKAGIISCDIAKFHTAPNLDGQKFDLVFIDPPYEKGFIGSVLTQSWFIELLADNCTIIAEQSHKGGLEFLPPVLDIYRQKKYSKTLISFLKKTLV